MQRITTSKVEFVCFCTEIVLVDGLFSGKSVENLPRIVNRLTHRQERVQTLMFVVFFSNAKCVGKRQFV